jgi:homoserine/homoserine lactone efflux protein
MPVETLAIFVGTCVLLALTPGPNMSLIVAATLSGGFRAGMTTLAGTGTGLAILTAIAAIGMTSVMVLMSQWFDVVRIAGAAYLMVLGIRQLISWWRRRGRALPPPPVSSGTSYMQGLLVALSNPKVLLFLGAFLPQFVDPKGDAGPQLAILGVLFVVTLLLVDLGYTAAVARARQTMSPRLLGGMDAAAGGLMMAGGLFLLTARRS